MAQTTDGSRIGLLETMLRIRAYEERLAALIARPSEAASERADGQARPSGASLDALDRQDPSEHVHPCASIGQEACAAGVIAALEPRDRILTNHRSAGHLIARGADPGRMLAEVLGRSDGYCKGKSGAWQISAKELGIVLTSAIAGSELAMVTGVALAQKLGHAEHGGITACFFGDGAACEGIFHESLNLAATWDLPVLYVCENNQWQGFVHRREAMRTEHLSSWAQKVDMAAVVVDGNDAEAVFAAASAAVAQIRRTSRPYFLELQTYRQRAHSEPDDDTCDEREELARWLERDPIAALCERMASANALTPAELETLRRRIGNEIDAAVLFAERSPWPSSCELTTDVYA